MFQPLRNLFTRPVPVWEEADLKHLVQEYLQDKLKTRRVTCVEVRDGKVTIEVGSAALKQAVQLLEFEIDREIKQSTPHTLKRLIVRVV